MKKKKLFFILLILLLIISILGLSNFNHLYLVKQISWILIGLLSFFFIKKVNISFIIKYSFIIYLINNILLLLVLIISKEINGSRAWISLGAFSFQPSELMKISLALVYYKLLKDNHDNSLLLLKIIILFLIPSVLVFLEPDTGAVIMYFIIMMITIFNSKIKKEYIFAIFLLGIILLTAFFFLYFYKTDYLIKILGTSIYYRIDRLIKFKNNYQLNQALIYIGSAGLKGHKGILYVPEAHTDFIFAFLIGRYGIIMGIIILIIYMLLDLLLINNFKNNYLLKVFTYLFIFSQADNILMNIGLLPIMGIPLPFLSYGGTNIIISLVFLGIILNKKN